MARTWEECVAAARVAAAKRDAGSWEFARAAFEAIAPGRPGYDTGVKDAIVRFAAETGYKPRTVERFRSVAKFWGVETPTVGGVELAWSVCRLLSEQFTTRGDALILLRRLEGQDPETASGRWTEDAVKEQLKRRPTKHERSGHAAATQAVKMVIAMLETAEQRLRKPALHIDEETRTAAVADITAARKRLSGTLKSGSASRPVAPAPEEGKLC